MNWQLEDEYKYKSYLRVNSEKLEKNISADKKRHN